MSTRSCWATATSYSSATNGAWQVAPGCRYIGHERVSRSRLVCAPRAAFSHSASVGRRLPIQAQYALALYQLTCTTGCVSRPARLLSLPLEARQLALGT